MEPNENKLFGLPFLGSDQGGNHGERPEGSVADPWHFGVDPDPDTRIHASD